MKILLCIFLMPFGKAYLQTFDLTGIRGLYQRAPELKSDAMQLNQLMEQVGIDSADPVLLCYKGANEMITAKYALNPFVKYKKVNTGKIMIQKAVCRDTLNLEMRFIRYSIQSSLPAFLGYRSQLESDERFLLNNTKKSKDTELKEMIHKYLSTARITKRQPIKQLAN
jgi:hypothetical protein